jgi:hypothetical protein
MDFIQRIANRPEPNLAESAARNGGSGRSFKVASVMTASIPSEPVKNLGKSNPVIF